MAHLKKCTPLRMDRTRAGSNEECLVNQHSSKCNTLKNVAFGEVFLNNFCHQSFGLFQHFVASFLNGPILASFSVYFCLFDMSQFEIKFKLLKVQMVCLEFKPGVAGWKAQINPLSYGGIPQPVFVMNVSHNYCHFLVTLLTRKWPSLSASFPTEKRKQQCDRKLLFLGLSHDSFLT